MKCVVRAYLDVDNKRTLIYEKECDSYYILHIAVEEAMATQYTIVVITKR